MWYIMCHIMRGVKRRKQTMRAPSTNWTLVIRPRSGAFDLRLRELWAYRELIGLFVRRDFVAYYKQTILGPLWYLLQPLLTTLTFTVIFGKLARMPTEGVPPFLFYLCGITLWGFFSECLSRSSSTFLANTGLFGKVYFPRLSVPISMALSGLIKLGIQLAFLAAFTGYFMARGADVHPGLALAGLPLLVLIAACLGLGGGLMVSSLTVKYRDLQHLVAFGIQLLMYATPIVWPLGAVPARYRLLAALNPLSAPMEAFRHAALGAGTWDWGALAYSGACAMLALVLGMARFNRVERTFMDTV